MLAILFSVHISLVTSNSVPNIGNQFDGDCFEYGIDYIGFDLDDGHYVSTENAAACQISCQNTDDCEFWTWDPDYHTACWRK